MNAMTWLKWFAHSYLKIRYYLCTVLSYQCEKKQPKRSYWIKNAPYVNIVIEFTHIIVDVTLLPGKVFLYIFGVNHLVLNRVETQNSGEWFVMKALIYSFLYTGLKVGEKSDIWAVTDLLGLVTKLRKPALLTSASTSTSGISTRLASGNLNTHTHKLFM